MQNRKIVYQTQQSSTLKMTLPTSKLAKAWRQGHHCLAAAGLRESYISVGKMRGNSTEDNHHRCRMVMEILRDL